MKYQCEGCKDMCVSPCVLETDGRKPAHCPYGFDTLEELDNPCMWVRVDTPPKEQPK